MIPDDERLTDAMHRLEPEPADAPDLFERVSAGVRRRRLRIVSGTAVAGTAAVVAVIAIVPALGGGSSHTPQAATAAAGNPVLPVPATTGEVGIAGPAATFRVAVTPPPPASPPSTPVLSTAVPPTGTPPPPTPLLTDAKGCPTIPSLPPGADAAAQAKAAALAAVPKRYGAAAAAKADVTSVYAAATGQHYGIVADAICGKTLGDNSYVVELGFGGNSASVGSGQLFVADFPGGWQVWFQYH